MLIKVTIKWSLNDHLNDPGYVMIQRRDKSQSSDQISPFDGLYRKHIITQKEATECGNH